MFAVELLILELDRSGNRQVGEVWRGGCRGRLAGFGRFGGCMGDSGLCARVEVSYQSTDGPVGVDVIGRLLGRTVIFVDVLGFTHFRGAARTFSPVAAQADRAREWMSDDLEAPRIHATPGEPNARLLLHKPNRSTSNFVMSSSRRCTRKNSKPETYWVRL